MLLTNVLDDFANIRVAQITFELIFTDWDNKQIQIDYRIGSQRISDICFFKDSYYFASIDRNGLIVTLKYSFSEYVLFITSSDLHRKLKSNIGEIIKDAEDNNKDLFVDFIINHDQYKIYCLRKYSIINSNQISKPNLNRRIKFNNFYYADIDMFNSRKFISLQIPIGTPRIIEIENHRVQCLNYDFNFRVFFGKFSIDDKICNLFLIQIEDLIQLQKIYIPNKPLSFILNDQPYVLPTLPIIKNSKSRESELYTDLLTRSIVSCIRISAEETLFVNDSEYYNQFEEKNLIICDTYDQDVILNQQVEKKKLFSNNLNIYPCVDENGSKFFKEIVDYSEFKYSPFEDEENSYVEEYEEESRYPDYWDELEASEKFEEDFDLAMEEYSDPFDDAKREFQKYEAESALESRLFNSEKRQVGDIVSKLYCVYCDYEIAVFEWERNPGAFQRIAANLVQNHFCNGISVFSGVIHLYDRTYISFSLLKKNEDLLLSNYLESLQRFKNLKVIDSEDCLILFEMKFCNVIIEQKSSNNYDNDLFID